MRLGIIAVSLAIVMLGSASADIAPYPSGSFEGPVIAGTEEAVTPSGWNPRTFNGADYFTVLRNDGEASDGDQYVELRTSVDDPAGKQIGLIINYHAPFFLEEDMQYRVLADMRYGEVAPTAVAISLSSKQLGSRWFNVGDLSADWATLETGWGTPDPDEIGVKLQVQFQCNEIANANAGVQVDNIRIEYGPILLGDFDGNGAVNGLDIPDFKAALANPDEWAAENPLLLHPNDLGDFDENGAFNGLDIPGFKEALAGEAVPEPATLSLVGLAALGVLRRRR